MTPEAKARQQIDERLIQAGWVIQDMKQLNLGASLGVAVREFPTDTGPADYVLFVEREPVGVIEAKRDEAGENITTAEDQTQRYANASRLEHHLIEFDLRKKYAKQVNIHLSEHEFGMSMAFESGPATLQRYLAGTANGHMKNFGLNDWRTALFRGLAQCDAFWNGGFKKALGIVDAAALVAVPQPVNMA